MIGNWIYLAIVFFVVSQRSQALLIGVPVAAVAVVKLLALAVSLASFPLSVLIGYIRKDWRKIVVIIGFIIGVMAILTYLYLHYLHPINSVNLSMRNESAAAFQRDSGLDKIQDNSFELPAPTEDLTIAFIKLFIEIFCVVFPPILITGVIVFDQIAYNQFRKKTQLIILVMISWLVSTLVTCIFYVI